MSSDIIKSISVKRRADGKGFEVSLTCVASNVRPLTFHHCTFGEFETKAEAEREIVRQYMLGSFKGGGNKYNDIATIAILHPDAKAKKLYPEWVPEAWEENGIPYTEADKDKIDDFASQLEKEAREKAFAIYETWETDKDHYYVVRDDNVYYPYLHAIHGSGSTRWSTGTRQAKRYTRAKGETVIFDHDGWTLERAPKKLPRKIRFYGEKGRITRSQAVELVGKDSVNLNMRFLKSDAVITEDSQNVRFYQFTSGEKTNTIGIEQLIGTPEIVDSPDKIVAEITAYAREVAL